MGGGRGDPGAAVEVGSRATEGTRTEIGRGALEPGTEIVVGENADEPLATADNNPFGPPQFGRGKARKKGA